MDQPNHSTTTVAIENKVDALIGTSIKLQKQLIISVISRVIVSILIIGGLVQISRTQKTSIKNQNLLIECTTPGTNPNPKNAADTGNACWDRLHDPANSAAAITALRVSIDCTAIYVVLKENPSACSDVIGRIEALRKGKP